MSQEGRRNIYFGSLENELSELSELNELNEINESSVNQSVITGSHSTRTDSRTDSTRTDTNSPHSVEFDRRALAKTLKIPTTDASVRSFLIALNQPITLFGEGPAERRDRLKLMASRAIMSLPRAFELFPCLKDLVSGDGFIKDTTSNESDSDDEEFYVPGSTNLVKVRSFLLEDSITRHHPSKPIDHVTEISTRTDLYTKLAQNLDLRWSTVDPNGRPLSTCTFSSDGNLFTGDWAGRLMKYKFMNNYASELISCTGDRITATCSNSNNELLTGNATGKITIYSAHNTAQNIVTLATSLPTCHAIKSLNWHPSNQFFASVSADSLWRLWDAPTATEIQVQEGHVGGVSAGAWHPDGALYCTGGTSDGLIRVWDCRLGKSIWTITGDPKASLTYLQFSPQIGHLLASTDSDGLLQFHDLRKLEANYAKTAAHRSCCSGLKFIAGGRAVITSGFDGAVRAWCPGDLRLIKEVQVSSSKVTAVDTWESDGEIKFAAVTFDRSVKIFTSLL